MAEDNTPVTSNTASAPPPPAPVTPTEITSAEAMGMREMDVQLFKRAQFLSTSTIIPKDFQNNPANCYIAVEMAHRMSLPPMFVMNGLYIVHGRPAWSAKFLITLAKSTVLQDLTYVVDKSNPKNWTCVCHAVTKTGRKVEGPQISVELAKAWGWWDKNPIWKNGTELMLRYRAAAWLISTEFPECAQGLLTKEEEDDIHAVGGSASARLGTGGTARKSLDDLISEPETVAN